MGNAATVDTGERSPALQAGQGGMMEYRRKRYTVVQGVNGSIIPVASVGCSFLPLLLMTSFALSAPQQLQNKTITASWSVVSTLVAPNGRVFTPTTRQQRVIYVSSTGRAFVKATVSGARGGGSAELAPGEKTPDGGARDV